MSGSSGVMKIGELARRAGVSVRSLRYYEERALISARRTPGGQRVFAADAVDRVVLIQLLFAAGLTSEAIVKLLPCAFSGTTTPAMISLLREERESIDRRARELAATRDRLDDLIIEASDRLVGNGPVV